MTSCSAVHNRFTFFFKRSEFSVSSAQKLLYRETSQADNSRVFLNQQSRFEGQAESHVIRNLPLGPTYRGLLTQLESLLSHRKYAGGASGSI